MFKCLAYPSRRVLPCDPDRRARALVRKKRLLKKIVDIEREK